MKEQYINDMVKVYRSDNNKVLTKYSLVLVHLIPFWLVWTEIECTVHFAMPLNRFQPVWQSRQQVVKAHCSDKYIVAMVLMLIV